MSGDVAWVECTQGRDGPVIAEVATAFQPSLLMPSPVAEPSFVFCSQGGVPCSGQTDSCPLGLPLCLALGHLCTPLVPGTPLLTSFVGAGAYVGHP